MKKYTDEQRYKLNRLLLFLCFIYGNALGHSKYKKYLQGNTLKFRMFLYGKLEGKHQYDDYIKKISYSRTLDAYIDKYGKSEGTKKYLEKNKKLSVGYNTLKNKGLSDEEIKKIKDAHSTKSSLKNKYGEKEYKNYLLSEKYFNPRNKEKVIKKFNFSEEEAVAYINSVQRRDLKFFIKKYGDEVGKLKYDIANKKRAFANTLDYYIKKYGKEEGKIKYSNRISSMKYKLSLEGHIEKYGRDEGIKKYNSLLNSRVNKSYNSNIQLEFSNEIYNNLPDEIKKYFEGAPISNNFILNVHNKNIYDLKIIVPDIRLKNIILEFDGDFWHSFPEIKLRDNKKDIIYANLNFKIMRISESSYRLNKTETINIVNRFIIENFNENFKIGELNEN